MVNDDERDYAEEAANRALIEEHDEDPAPPLRARVTLTLTLMSSGPLDDAAGDLAAWVADRLGWVTDNGPYEFGTGGERREIDFGPIKWDDDAVQVVKDHPHVFEHYDRTTGALYCACGEEKGQA